MKIKERVLTYCIKTDAHGHTVFTNRRYKPVGFFTSDYVTYEDYPVAMVSGYPVGERFTRESWERMQMKEYRKLMESNGSLRLWLLPAFIIQKEDSTCMLLNLLHNPVGIVSDKEYNSNLGPFAFRMDRPGFRGLARILGREAATGNGNIIDLLLDGDTNDYWRRFRILMEVDIFELERNM